MKGRSIIYLLGIGQRFPQHITAETMDLLERSQTIFTLLSDKQIKDFPASISRNCVSLHSHYVSTRPRRENYLEVANLILNAARKANGPIGYLTLGSPRVLDSVSQVIIDKAGEEIEVIRTCAVSSFDSVLSDVDYDPASGVQVVEANQLILYRTPLTASLACLIFQPSMFGTDKPRLHASSPAANLEDLRDHLLKFWDPSHPAAFVYSYYWADGRARVFWTILGGLAEVDSDYVRGATLFLPPRPTSPIDHSFARRLAISEFG